MAPASCCGTLGEPCMRSEGNNGGELTVGNGRPTLLGSTLMNADVTSRNVAPLGL